MNPLWWIPIQVAACAVSAGATWAWLSLRSNVRHNGWWWRRPWCNFIVAGEFGCKRRTTGIHADYCGPHGAVIRARLRRSSES